jgi:hypothetical protein
MSTMYWAMGILGGVSLIGCMGSIAEGTDERNEDEDGFEGEPGKVPVVDEIGPDGKPRVYAPLHPVPATMMRLTHQQYVNTISDIFGPEAVTKKELEDDEKTELFLSIGAARVGTSQRGAEQYQEAALDVAAKVMERRTAYPWLANCKPSNVSDPCIDDFIRTVGRRLWRRTVTDEEVAKYKNIVGADGNTATKLETGMYFALAGMVQSPYFLYINLGEDDPDSGGRRYTSIENASRLAYFIWNSTPDEALLDAGESGHLVDPDGIRQEVGRMLGEARAKDLAGSFFSESWLISKLTLEDKNRDVFKYWNAGLLDSYREEFHRVMRDFASDDPRDLRGILTTKQTIANSTLAAFYGITGDGPEFVPVDLDERRVGILTSGAVIAANSPSDRSSPTHRGVFVVERLLCREIPPPPADVDNVLDVSSSDNEGKSVREVLEQHRVDPACSGCHALFDPAGMTFEAYDGIGAFRTEDKGHAIDTSGELDDRHFANVEELAAYVHDHEETGRCMTKQLYQFATAHAFTEGEQGVVDLVADRFAGKGYLWGDLVGEVVTSAGFRLMAASE